MKSVFSHLLFASWVLGSAARICSAHEVWIEDTAAGQLVVRFAEWGDEFEKSPGHLDRLSLPEAWTPAGDGSVAKLEVKKIADGFAITGAAVKTPVQAETAFDVMVSKPQAGSAEVPVGRKPFFYMRWHVAGSGAAKPTLNFDLVPTAKPGEFCVFLRGKPLPDVAVIAHLPEGKEEELKSDKDGLVRVVADRPGFYMLNCKHQRETVSGFSGGQSYGAISHNSSVAWRQSGSK